MGPLESKHYTITTRLNFDYIIPNGRSDSWFKLTTKQHVTFEHKRDSFIDDPLKNYVVFQKYLTGRGGIKWHINFTCETLEELKIYLEKESIKHFKDIETLGKFLKGK
jgi:hypothetical protein